MPNNAHTLNIVLGRRLTSVNKGKVRLAIRYKKGTLKKDRQIPVTISEKHWSKEARHIKDTKWGKYPAEVKLINKIKEGIPEAIIKLTKGTITYKNAFTLLMDISEETKGTLLEFANTLKPSRTRGYNLKESAIIRLKERIRALENKYLPDKFIPLTFETLRAEENVNQIADILYKTKLKQDTITKYMSACDTLYKHRTQNDFKPFGRLKLTKYVKYQGKQKPVSDEDVFLAPNNITTIQDLEACLIWLYSFCLLGMDLNDIVNIDESKIQQKDYKYYWYHPEIDKTKPLHIKILRGKLKEEDAEKVPIQRMINLFPIYLIRQMLSHLIKHNRPELAYNGKDKLKLYNFYTKDSNNEEVEGAMQNMAKLRNTYTKKWKKIFGHTIKHTRATSMQAGRKVGADFQELEAQLGHIANVSKVFNTYYSENQQAVDRTHIYALMEYDIMKVLNTIMDMFKDKVQVINNVAVKWISDSILQHRADPSRLEYIFPLASLSPEEFKEMQDLLRKMKKVKVFNDKTGKNEIKEVRYDNYPDRLKELLSKQKESQKEHISDLFPSREELNNIELVEFDVLHYG